jgi:hypothetical protein
MLKTGQEEILKITQGMRADGMDQIVANEGLHRAFVSVDIQVVEPKLGHFGQERILGFTVSALVYPPSHGGAAHVFGEFSALCVTIFLLSICISLLLPPLKGVGE